MPRTLLIRCRTVKATSEWLASICQEPVSCSVVDWVMGVLLVLGALTVVDNIVAFSTTFRVGVLS